MRANVRTRLSMLDPVFRAAGRGCDLTQREVGRAFFSWSGEEFGRWLGHTNRGSVSFPIADPSKMLAHRSQSTSESHCPFLLAAWEAIAHAHVQALERFGKSALGSKLNSTYYSSLTLGSAVLTLFFDSQLALKPLPGYGHRESG